MIVKIDWEKKLHVEHWSGNKPEYALNLRTWGEAGTIKLKTQMTGKLEDRGVQCMFVGYAKDHAGDVYRMWDPDTNRIHETRDIIWLRRMYFEKPKPTYEVIAPIEYNANDLNSDKEAGDNFGVREGDDENDETSVIVDMDQAEEAEEKEEVEEPLDNVELDAGIVTRSGQSISKPTRLIEEMGACSYEIGLSVAEQEYYNVMWKMNKVALVGAGIGGGFIDTNELHVMKYKEAMAGKDADKWQKAVDKEHECMMKHEVWMSMPIEEVPENSKILTSTWAMKKKANGTYRARMNAQGYEQVDGVHYNEDSKAAPVVNEIVIRMVMVLIVMALWWAELLDVQVAFLTGEMDLENGALCRFQRDFLSSILEMSY